MIDDDALNDLLSRFPHVSPRELAVTASILTDDPLSHGYGLSSKTAFRILEAAIRSSSQTGFSLSDVACALAQTAIRSETADSQQHDVSEPAVYIDLSIAIACESTSLARQVCQVLVGLKNTHAVVGKLDDFCRLQVEVDVLVLAVPAGVDAALRQLQRASRLGSSLPIVVIGPRDAGLALECLCYGAAEYVALEDLRACLTKAVTQALAPEEPPCEALEDWVATADPVEPDSIWSRQVGAVREWSLGICRLFSVSRDAFRDVVQQAALSTLAGGALGCGLAWAAYLIIEAVFAGSIEALQRVMPTSVSPSAPTLATLFWPALAAGTLAGGVYWLVAPILCPRLR